MAFHAEIYRTENGKRTWVCDVYDEGSFHVILAALNATGVEHSVA